MYYETRVVSDDDEPFGWNGFDRPDPRSAASQRLDSLYTLSTQQAENRGVSRSRLKNSGIQPHAGPPPFYGRSKATNLHHPDDVAALARGEKVVPYRAPTLDEQRVARGREFGAFAENDWVRGKVAVKKSFSLSEKDLSTLPDAAVRTVPNELYPSQPVYEYRTADVVILARAKTAAKEALAAKKAAKAEAKAAKAEAKAVKAEAKAAVVASKATRKRKATGPIAEGNVKAKAARRE